MLRATQLLPNTRYNQREARAYTTLGAHAEYKMAFKVEGGGTLEVTLAQFWGSVGEGHLSAEVAFHGLQVTPAAAVLDGAAGFTKMFVRWVGVKGLFFLA